MIFEGRGVPMTLETDAVLVLRPPKKGQLEGRIGAELLA
jgi:hypothetical protein